MSKFRLAISAAIALAAASPLLADDIVVTGKPLSQTAAELAACLKAKCSPDKDIAASLAHAENLFVAGDYPAAQRTLHASLGRNRRHGGEYPVAVSDLLRANSRVAEHLGEARDYQLSVLDARDTLRKGFGDSDFRTLVAQVEVGDSRAKLGFLDEAERVYRDVEEKAIAAKQYRVASFARLRLAVAARIRFDDEASGYNREQLDKRLDLLINNPLPGGDEFALAAQVLKAKVDRKSGSTASTDALVRHFAEQGGANRPILLYSEPLRAIDPRAMMPEGLNQPREGWTTWTTNRNGEWADVGFWVNQSGHVTDVEVLRSKGDASWLKPVLGNVSRRVYAPLRKDGDATPGFYMVERYTLTSVVSEEVTGTHLRTRGATPRIERLDLTPDNYAAPKT